MSEAEKSFSFISRTSMGRDQEAKLLQLLNTINNTFDSIPFRQPVDWKGLNLMDYPTIVTRPMDLSTIKKKISCKNYENVEDALEDIILIWDNAKLYNPKEHQIHKLADKLEKQTKKMIKNYLPFVKMQAQILKKKQPPKKQTKAPTKTPLKTQQPKTYLQKQQEAKNQQINENVEAEEPPQAIERKNLLFLIQLCSKEQIGVIFLLTRGNCPECIEYDDEGRVTIHGQKINDVLLKRLLGLMEMWGISLKSFTTGKRK